MDIPKKRKGKQQPIPEEIIVPEGSYEYPGVVKITLSEKVQILIECKVGVHINGEHTWKNINKDVLKEYILLNPVENEVKSISKEISDYPEDEILFVYIPEDGAAEDQFYVCTTPTCKKSVEVVIQKNEEKLKNKIQNMIHKDLNKWKSCGSEKEIEDFKEDPFSRTSFEIEIDAQFSVCDQQLKFKNRNVEDTIEGYAELAHCGRVEYDLVYKTRIDLGIQSCPVLDLKNEQTSLRYPTNISTQYEYAFDINDKDKAGAKSKTDQETLSANIADEMCNEVLYNSNLNLYKNEFGFLKNTQMNSVSEELKFDQMKSFSSTINHNKLISCVSWHPMWTGCVAIAYANSTRSCQSLKYQSKVDYTFREVHVQNSVCFWSITDDLNPKLILESDREVVTIQFCPHDENLLAAGCTNGQIIIWDIKNKLDEVERTEVLTLTQKNNRKTLFSMMDWFKNIKNDAMMRPTVISALEHSHKGSVTKIEWISARYSVDLMGKISKIPDGKANSLQFVSCSEDGTLLIWDLKYKPPLGRKEAKVGKSKDNLRRPTFLSSFESEYKPLNKVFKPIYQIVVLRPDKRFLPLMDISILRQHIEYRPVNPAESTNHTIRRRVIYTPAEFDSSVEFDQTFAAVSLEGDFLIAEWKGVDFISSTAVNSETCSFLSLRKTHTGPATSIDRSPFMPSIFLTVGGRSVCIWSSKFPNNFLSQKSSKRRYTMGVWSPYKLTSFFLACDEGVIEIWDYVNKNDLPTYHVNCSGLPLSGVYLQPIQVIQNVIGICEHPENFRIFFIPEALMDPYERIEMHHRIIAAQGRKEKFKEWEINWKKENEERLKREQFELEEELQLREHQLEQENTRRENEERILEEKRIKSLALGDKPQPGKYFEWAEAKWHKQQQDRVYRNLINKKKLDQNELIRLQAPLLEFDKQAKRKEEKQHKLLSEKQKIFSEVSASLTPNASHAISFEYPKLIGTTDKDSLKHDYLDEYERIENETMQYIEKHPCTQKFVWRDVIKTGLERLKSMDVVLKSIPKRKPQVQEKVSLQAINDLISVDSGHDSITCI